MHVKQFQPKARIFFEMSLGATMIYFDELRKVGGHTHERK